MIQLTINGTTYNFPSQGDNPAWGDEVSDAVSAIVDVLNTLSGTADILTTSFTVANNISSVTNVTGLNFDSSTVRSAVIQYSIYRVSSTPTELSEAGLVIVTYKSVAGTWELAQSNVGSSGVTFTITNAGQVQYTSTDIGSTGYSGKMKFKAAAFLQA